MTRNFALVLIFFISSIAHGQQDRYRFNFFLGSHSIVNWGTKKLSNVYQPSDGYPKYQTEHYDIEYKKNNYSPGVSLGLGIDWVSQKHFVLRQEVSAFMNFVTEEIVFEIIDVGNGDTTGRKDVTTEKVNLGYKGKVLDYGKSFGTKVGILGLIVKDKFKFGFGLNWTRRYSQDVFLYGTGYNPWSWGRQTMNYLTHQLDADFRIEYCFGRWSAFLNYSHKIANLKKEKGAKYFDDPVSRYPFSHNLDYRFPSMISIGLALNFDKIKSND